MHVGAGVKVVPQAVEVVLQRMEVAASKSSAAPLSARAQQTQAQTSPHHKAQC
eukprot:COSAG03_NODE_4725_length_1455_cov_1.811947_1_plen_52_part_10